MVFEILGARIFWPYIGNSLFVWTSIIAVVLWALAAGYYHGWVIADKWVWKLYISRLFLWAGISFIVLYLIKDPILTSISTQISDIRLSSLLLSLLLLSPSSYILGMIPPILVKNELLNLETWWHTIGRIGSIWTIWSIIWTLATWFFLLPYIGINTLIILLSLFCFVLTVYTSIKNDIIIRSIFFLIILSCFTLEYLTEGKLRENNVFIYNSPYSRIEVSDHMLPSGEIIRNLFVDNITHAGRYLGSDKLLYPYTRYYHLFSVLNPEAKRVVMLWGAAYSYPQHFLQTYPEKYIDVVEIDAQMTQIAQKHFWLTENSRLRSIHQDGRVFLNQNTEVYDAILWDAFGSFFSVPYQLTTLEAVERKYDSLSENWVVILNIIGSLQWEKWRFIQSQYHTYKAIFPEVFLLPVDDHKNTSQVQNIMLIAMKNPQSAQHEIRNWELRGYLTRKTYLPENNNIPLLTDDFAPVDYYIKALAR